MSAGLCLEARPRVKTWSPVVTLSPTSWLRRWPRSRTSGDNWRRRLRGEDTLWTQLQKHFNSSLTAMKQTPSSKSLLLLQSPRFAYFMIINKNYIYMFRTLVRISWPRCHCWVVTSIYKTKFRALILMWRASVRYCIDNQRWTKCIFCKESTSCFWINSIWSSLS